MNASRLTAEQRTPTISRGFSIALASGAGCGKTTVLTERFLSLLDGEGRLPLSRIVALTFTEKAARQLRQRVRQGCRERVETGGDRPYWRHVLRELETAKISTFHSFCGVVLRQFAIEADLDPSFAVLDESMAPTYRERALDSSLRRWLAARDLDFAALAVDYGLTPVREALADILQSRPAIDLGDWARLEPREVVARWETYHARRTPLVLSRFAEDQRALLNTLRENPPSHKKTAARCLRLIEEIPLLASEPNPLPALEAIRENAMVKGSATKDWASEEVYEYVKLKFKRMRDHIDKLRTLLAPDEGRSLAAAESGVASWRGCREMRSAHMTRRSPRPACSIFTTFRTAC